MANTVALTSGQVSAEDLTTVGAAVDTITIVDDWSNVRVETNGAAELYVTLDGSVPTAGGHNTFMIPQQTGVPQTRDLPVPEGTPSGANGWTFKALSAGVVIYSIEKVG